MLEQEEVEVIVPLYDGLNSPIGRELKNAEGKLPRVKKNVLIEKYSLSLFFLSPVGVDKIHAEIIMNRESVVLQMDSFRGRWKKRQEDVRDEKDKRDKRKRALQDKYSFSIKEAGEEVERFHFTLHQRFRWNPFTWQKGFDFVLLIQFNPSQWEYLTGSKGAVKGQNYVAGGAEALEMAMDDLGKILESAEFDHLRNLCHQKVDVQMLTMNHLHLARDIRARPLASTPLGGADSAGDWEHLRCSDVLNQFLNASPTRIAEADPNKSKNYHIHDAELKRLGKAAKKGSLSSQELRYLKWLKKLTVGRNPLLGDYNYLSRGNGSRHDVFYVKKQFDGNKAFLGAALRFEHKLVKGAEIKQQLGTNILEGLRQHLLKVEAWHQGGKRGAIPIMEDLLDKRIESWNQPSSYVKSKLKLKFFPKPVEDSVKFLTALEKAIYADQCLLFESKDDAAHQARLDWIEDNIIAKKPLDVGAAQSLHIDLNIAIIALGPNTFHRIAGQVTGYLDATGRKVAGKDVRRAYDRLMGWVEFFCDFYDGNFLGFSKYEQRKLFVEHLIQQKPTAHI